LERFRLDLAEKIDYTTQMRTDKFGQIILDENDLCNLYLTDPTRKLSSVIYDDDITIPDFINDDNLPNFIKYLETNINIEEFDKQNQSNWFMPEKYKNMDIAKYVLDLCQNDSELQRVGEELLLFQERDMFDLLRYLKYLVDVMRENNIVWGVGRGSSVSSFVLYLIGVHKINSLYYDLSINEFIK
jgi:DNA polymerase III alpha subunit